MSFDISSWLTDRKLVEGKEEMYVDVFRVLCVCVYMFSCILKLHVYACIHVVHDINVRRAV